MITEVLATFLAQSGANVYFYKFNLPPTENSILSEIMGATHGSELPFFFMKNKFRGPHVLSFYDQTLRSVAGKRVQVAMSYFMRSFIHSGNPNYFRPDTTLPSWSKVNGYLPWSGLNFSEKGIETDKLRHPIITLLTGTHNMSKDLFSISESLSFSGMKKLFKENQNTTFCGEILNK